LTCEANRISPKNRCGEKIPSAPVFIGLFYLAASHAVATVMAEVAVTISDGN
jgi:hypothetical protein